MISEETLLTRGLTRQEYEKEYQENHREKSNAWREKNKERLNAKYREYYHNNKELMAAKDKARNQAGRLDYKQAMQANKEAKRQGKLGKVTEAEWVELKSSYGNRCVYCGASSFKLTLDHFEPLSGIGTNEIENIIPACSFCNYAKNNKPFIIFLGWKNGAFN